MTDKVEKKAGYLIIRINPGEGVQIGDQGVEVRLSTNHKPGSEDVEIAIKAPRDIKIRRVK